MKASRILKGAMVGLAMLLATSAFAVAASKGSLQVSAAVNVAGKQLPAGNYSLQWQGSGPNVELNIMQGKKLIATVPAKIVSLPQAASYDSAVVSTSSDGSRMLSQIRFSGKTLALEVSGGAGGVGAGGGSSN